MPRKRMLDPSFWRDEKIGQCTYIERLLFEGLWTFADDNGVGRANPLLLKADIFPYDPLREADIKSGLEKLSSLGLILLYEIDTQNYYYVTNFKRHQTINKPTPSALPEPLPEHYRSPTGGLPPEEKLKEVEDKLREEKGKRARKATAFTPPTLEEVTVFVSERKSPVIPQDFIDFYASKGWVVGKVPMKDWKAACRSAEKWDRWSKGAPQPVSTHTTSATRAEIERMQRIRDKIKGGG